MVATKGLGELFVELGLKGLGGTLKGLNAVSAQFLLTKNAAEQAIKPISNLSQKAGNNILDLEKTAMRMSGVNAQSLYSLQQFARANRANAETVINDLKNMQQTIIEIRKKGGGQFFDQIGIDPTSLDWKKPFETMDYIVKTLNKIGDPSVRANAYSMLQITEETQWLYEKGERTFTKYNSLDKERLANLKQQGEQWNKLNVEVDVLKDKVMASGPIAVGLSKALEIVEKTHDALDGEKNVIWGIGQFINKYLLAPIRWYFEVLQKVYNISEKLNTKTEEQINKEATKNLKNKPFASVKKDAIAGSFNVYDSSLNKNIEVSGVSIPSTNVEAIKRARQYEAAGYAKLYKGKQDNYIVVHQTINTSDPLLAGKEASNGIKQIDLNNAKLNNGAIQ